MFRTSFGQKIVFSGYTLDNETHDTVPNVRLELSSRPERDTINFTSNEHGYFSLTINNSEEYFLVATEKKYRHLAKWLRTKDTIQPVIYYLYEPAISSYFPEFTFEQNSSISTDTTFFYAFDLNKYSLDPKIIIVGYYSPDEKPELGLKRAKHIYNGFINRCADPTRFIIDTKPQTEAKMNYGHHVYINDVEYFFKKGLVIDKKYIDTLTGDKKLAAKKLLQTVRLRYQRK